MYPFTGIRGDSKELWNGIKAQRIKNVELVKADTLIEQQAHMADADIVIIACGYESNSVPIVDCMGSKIPL